MQPVKELTLSIEPSSASLRATIVTVLAATPAGPRVAIMLQLSGVVAVLSTELTVTVATPTEINSLPVGQDEHPAKKIRRFSSPAIPAITTLGTDLQFACPARCQSVEAVLSWLPSWSDAPVWLQLLIDSG